MCFVRATLADPRVLILDEATSSGDTVTESRLQHALMKLLRRRTRNRQQLLALGGRYAHMYQQVVSSTDLGVASLGR